MIRKIGLTLFGITAMLSSVAYAIPTHSLLPGITLEYELPPNNPQYFVNYMFWTVEANCLIYTQDDADVLFAEVVNRKARLNDLVLVEGQSIDLTVRPGDHLKIGADPGAKVRITNMGNSLVKAVCTA